MTDKHLLPAHRSDLITLELGANCYGVTAITHEHPLDIKPLPAGMAQPDGVCGLVRLDDGSSVPVFDLRNAGGKTGQCRLLIAMGYHGEGHPISMAFLIDATARTAPRPRKRPSLGATALAFERN